MSVQMSWTSAVALATALVWPIAAIAQDARPTTGVADPGSDPSQDDNTADIVVTGVRASLQSAIARKRDASQIVDSIVAEDIGKLPDNNVAEALQRITGVQISRSQGEGSGIAIRGLSQVQTLLNGRNLFTTSGRGVALGDVPAEMLAGIDVYKSAAADQIEGGLGGLVDIRLRRPFDFADSEISLSARGFRGDIADRIDPRVSFLVSDRYDTGIGEIGVLVNLVYQQRSFGSYRNAIGTFGSRTDLYDKDGDGVFPNDAGDAIQTTTDAGTRYTKGTRKRYGVNTSLQWAPADHLQFYFDGLFNTTKNTEDDMLIYGRTGTSGIRISNAKAIPPFTFADGTNIFRTGSYSNARTTPSTYASDNNYDTYQGVFGGKWDDGALTLTAEGGYTFSKGGDRFTEIGIQTNAPRYTLDLTGGFPNVTFGGVNLNDFSVYTFDRYADSTNRYRGGEWVGRFDAAYELGGILKTVKAGFRYADRTAQRAGTNNAPTFGTSSNLPLPVNVPGMLILTPTDLFRNRSGQGTVQWATPSPAFVRQVARTRTLFGLDPNGPADDPRLFFDISEKTYAGYAEGLFAFELGGIAIDGNVGLRYVKTASDLNGFQSAPAGGFQASRILNDYGNWLPSMNLRAKLTQDLFLRAAASKVVTRPSFAQLTPATTLNYLFLNGSGGNPRLAPLRANQYDLSLEYYAKPGTLLYLAGFYKTVDGFIQNISANQVINGQTFLISSPQNGGNGKIKGFEVGGQTFFDFLPAPLDGLGIQANYTFVDSKAPSPIPGQSVPLENLSRNSYNLVGIYEKGPVSVRVAYNWRDKYVTATTGDAAFRPVIVKAMGQLDASVGFDVSKTVSLSIDATNLTRNKLIDYYGSENLPKSYNQYDRTIEAGVRVRF